MSQNNLGGFLFPAVAGLFFFMKRPSVNEVVHTHYPVFYKDTSGLTGVAKYLAYQDEVLQSQLLADELAKQQPEVSKSSVSKYLDSQEKIQVTGVAKYMLRQAIVERQQINTSKAHQGSGVERYLKNNSNNAPQLSGVAKYLKHQASLPQPSNVAKYMAKQAALEVLKAKVAPVQLSGVAKYLNLQESMPKPSKVEKYLAQQAILDAKKVNSVIVTAKNELTGVSKYLDHQASLPQPSKVEKYMKRQVLLEQSIPVIAETSVDKYMRIQG
ncbi:MAG: hypothetical protein D0531_11775 [Methylococcales bacterium]|nr:MAG: hypothetical protein D0531_11775 [Methylococcales bacterium]